MKSPVSALVPLVLWMSALDVHAEDAKPFHFDAMHLILPGSWAAKAQGRIVKAVPLYDERDAAAYKADKTNQLKPSYENMPRHIEISFDVRPVFPVKDHAFKPQITVHPVAEFLRIYEPEEDSVKRMTHCFDQLWSVATKPAKVNLARPLPFIPFLDATQGVTVGFKPVNFSGGKGFRFITQFEIETSLLSDDGLVYVFQALTDDRKSYVLATFPIHLEGLPQTNRDGEHLGYSTKQYEKLEKEIEMYHRKATKWLTESESKMMPELKTLDDIVASVKLDG